MHDDCDDGSGLCDEVGDDIRRKTVFYGGISCCAAVFNYAHGGEPKLLGNEEELRSKYLTTF